jgi:hypothetical protein
MDRLAPLGRWSGPNGYDRVNAPEKEPRSSEGDPRAVAMGMGAPKLRVAA